MEIQLAVLADYANAAAGQKLNVIGVFDSIRATAFPYTHPMMVLAIRSRFSNDDADREQKIEVTLRDEDGRSWAKARGAFEVGRMPPGEVRYWNTVLKFFSLTFAAPGIFEFHVAIGDDQKIVRLKVLRAEGGPREALKALPET
jgi:hypothetical protein